LTPDIATAEQKASIRARLLAGQEAARKQRENALEVKPDVKLAARTKKAVKKQASSSTKTVLTMLY
jgi:hypothetical protein